MLSDSRRNFFYGKPDSDQHARISCSPKKKTAKEKFSSTALGQATKLIVKEAQLSPQTFKRNLKQNWPLFGIMLTAYFTADNLSRKLGKVEILHVHLPQILDPMNIHLSKAPGVLSDALNLVTISASTIVLGFCMKFIADAYGQTGLYDKESNWVGTIKNHWRKICSRAAKTAVWTGALFSGLITANALPLASLISKNYAPSYLGIALVTLCVMNLVMIPYYWFLLMVRDKAEGRLQRTDMPEEEKRRNFNIGYWKSFYVGIPVVLTYSFIAPLLKGSLEGLRFSVLMFLSFTAFIVRTIATEQRYYVKDYENEKRG
ncbi:Uncharacterised protein [Candidatus Gugararchaeum adminiculabundum]|nr:Uncharacterised protein [Candidatus Gugararchaeum adminiculabundum]